VKTQWVLGIYDSQTKKGIILFVAKKDAATLIPLIRAHVKAGSIIWTDQWKAYARLRYYYEHQ